MLLTFHKISIRISVFHTDFHEISSEFELNFTEISQNFSRFLKLVAVIFKIHEF